jgi:hypothetical protein
MTDRYLKAINDGIKEYKGLSKQKKSLETRMQKVLQLIAANVNMLPDAQQELFISQLMEMTPPSGLREAIIRVLAKTENWLSPTEIRDMLVESGYDFAGQANPLASIHTTLKRLVDAEEAISNVPQPDGKTYYKRSEMRRGIDKMATLAELMRSYPPVTSSAPLAPRTRKTLLEKMREPQEGDKPKFYGR